MRKPPPPRPPALPTLVDCEGLGGRFTYGPGCSFGDGCYVDISGDVALASDVHFGREVEIITHHHPDYSIDGAPHKAVPDPLSIGDDVFIGDRAIILPQVSFVGSHAVIGAGAVVTKDVPSCAVVAGNPARIIRMRSCR